MTQHAAARTNAFIVKDPAAFRAEIRSAVGDQVLVHSGSLPNSVYLLPDPEANEGDFPDFAARIGATDEDVEDEFDVLGTIAPHLIEGQTAVLVCNSADKQRYLGGFAGAINSMSKRAQIRLDDVYELAVDELGADPLTITRAAFDGDLAFTPGDAPKGTPLERGLSKLGAIHGGKALFEAAKALEIERLRAELRRLLTDKLRIETRDDEDGSGDPELWIVSAADDADEDDGIYIGRDYNWDSIEDFLNASDTSVLAPIEESFGPFDDDGGLALHVGEISQCFGSLMTLTGADSFPSNHQSPKTSAVSPSMG